MTGPDNAVPEKAVESVSYPPVLILVFNGWEDTFASLEQMRSHTPNLWVIDNGSEVDRTAEVTSRFPEVQVMRLSKNYGFAGGYNRAIEAMRRLGHEAVYLLNNDAIAVPGAVQSAVRCLLNNTNTAAVGSAILSMDERFAFFDGALHEYGQRQVSALPDAPQEVPRLHGAGFAINLEVYYAIGPMNEAFFLYHEESEWCIRAKKHGWKLVFDPHSKVLHEGEGSSSGLNRAYYLTRNRFLAVDLGNPIDSHRTRIDLIASELRALRGKSNELRGVVIDAMIDAMLRRWGPRRLPWPKPYRYAWLIGLTAFSLGGRSVRKAYRLLRTAPGMSRVSS
jgi:GT2 family glycosyltransferase